MIYTLLDPLARFKSFSRRKGLHCTLRLLYAPHMERSCLRLLYAPHMERSWQCGYSSHYSDFQSAGGFLECFFCFFFETTDSTYTEKHMAEDELEACLACPDDPGGKNRDNIAIFLIAAIIAIIADKSR